MRRYRVSGRRKYRPTAADVDDNEVERKIFLVKESGIRFGGDF